MFLVIAVVVVARVDFAAVVVVLLCRGTKLFLLLLYFTAEDDTKVSSMWKNLLGGENASTMAAKRLIKRQNRPLAEEDNGSGEDFDEFAFTNRKPKKGSTKMVKGKQENKKKMVEKGKMPGIAGYFGLSSSVAAAGAGARDGSGGGKANKQRAPKFRALGKKIIVFAHHTVSLYSAFMCFCACFVYMLSNFQSSTRRHCLLH